MFRKNYKNLYSQKVPDELINKTLAEAEKFENRQKNKSTKNVYRILIPAGAVITAAAIMLAIFVLPLGNNHGSLSILSEEKPTHTKDSNSFFLTASAAESNDYSDVDDSITLSSGEYSYGWAGAGDYSEDDKDLVIDYKLDFKINGTNISSVTLDAEKFNLSLLPTGEEPSADSSHIYKIDNSPNGKLQEIEVCDLYYSYISDRSDSKIDEFVSNIFNAQRENKQLTAEKRQKYGDYYTTDSAEDRLDRQSSRYVFDLLDYVYRNAKINVSVTYENGTVETKTIYVDFVLSQAYIEPFNHTKNLYDSQYQDYSLVTDAEKDISYGWLVFKTYSDNRIAADESKKIIAVAEKHKDIYGGYYFDDNKRLNILMTDNYVEGKDPQLDNALKNAEIKSCEYTRSELAEVLGTAVENKSKCYDYGEEYYYFHILADYKMNRLICKIDDWELSQDDAESLKSKIKENVICGAEDYFIIETSDTQ